MFRCGICGQIVMEIDHQDVCPEAPVLLLATTTQTDWDAVLDEPDIPFPRTIDGALDFDQLRLS